MKNNIIIIVIVLGGFFSIQTVNAQSLIAGDIAFIGMNTRIKEGFTIITLTDIPANEKIFFSDRGIIDANSYVSNNEGTSLFTAPPDGVPCGTIISFEETSPDVYEIDGVSDAKITLILGKANFSSGDQVYAYQTTDGLIASKPSDAVFIAGIMSDYDVSCVHTDNRWTKSDCVATTSQCILPLGLTNGVNCISVTPSSKAHDNMKYTGVLNGSKDELMRQINSVINWEVNDTAVIDIHKSGFPTPSVDCSNSILTNIKYEISNEIRIFPNPTKNMLYIKGFKVETDYSIYNLFGKKIMKGKITKEESIDVSNLLTGIYFIKIKNYKTIRFIKK